ncbi:prephenate dehydrogenase [candidate division KSB1 bacterium]|nr:prephenate dehydrogenase [candidate division KSB1 bacterium]
MALCNRMCFIGLDGMVGSFALGMKRTGYQGGIVGVADNATVQQAWKLRVVTDGTPELARAVKGAGLVILSREAATLGISLCDVLACVEPGTIISEMTRVKGDVNRVFAESKRTDVSYVGFRLAGDADVQIELEKSSQYYFEHKTVILTPRGKPDLDAFSQLQEAMKRLGANVVAMSPQAHDRMLADINQAPRLAMMAAVEYVLDPARGMPVSSASMGAWLAEQMGELQQMQFSGWAHDVADNREPVLQALDQLLKQLATLREAVATGSLEQHLEQLAGASGKLVNPEVAQEASREIVLAAGGDTKVLEKAAQILAECRITVASLDKMHDAAAGTFCLTLNSPADRSRAATALGNAGLKITEIR